MELEVPEYSEPVRRTYSLSGGRLHAVMQHLPSCAGQRRCRPEGNGKRRGTDVLNDHDDLSSGLWVSVYGGL
jgi:hypothetical protein